MESMNKAGRLTRQGSRMRRQRSQEWQDYSSSDNEEEITKQQYRYPEEHGHQYAEQRTPSETRKHGLDRGRGNGNNNSSGRTYSHSSMELLTGRNYGGFSGSEGEMEGEARYPQNAGTPREPKMISGGKNNQFQRYGSLPRQNHGGSSSSREQISPMSRETARNAVAGSNPRGRLSLSLRRGPSSSSTSDNNSDATYTDSEFIARRRGVLESQNVFTESPPEPAPPAIPPRNIPPVHHMESLGRRPRLGYLESECESEPPYLPTMLSGPLHSYNSEDLSSASHPQQAVETSTASTEQPEDTLENANRINKNENERVYSQPLQVQMSRKDSDTSNSKTTIAAPPSAPVASNSTTANSTVGPTYCNPLPVFCSTPSSTTGPMVPMTNCVNPQFIQPPTAPGPVRHPFSTTSAFSSAAIGSSRFHFRKTCAHRCTWKMATIVLIIVSVILTATMAYFAAAMSALTTAPEATRPCIVVEEKGPESVTGTPVSLLAKDINTISIRQPVCIIMPRETSMYYELTLGSPVSRTLEPHESWSTFFSHPEAAFIRLNFSIPHGSRLAILGRKNDPPSLTAYDIMDVAGDDQQRYTRAALPNHEISFIHYLEPGTWYLSIINDDSTSVNVAFHPELARDLSTSCPNNCNHHGNCQLGKCHCFPGYIGHDCGDSVCPVHCSGHGRYVQGACRCEQGWKGAECSVPITECEVPDCNSHGSCSEGRCTCHPGFRGIHCEDVDCFDPSCSGHGLCVDGKCWCKTGWKGVNCSEADVRLTRCFPDCSTHGVYDLDSESCVCFDLWTGSDCSRAKCSLDCGQHGRCEEGKCRCDEGWMGDHCDERSCDHRCHEHGQCNNGTCVCRQGWTGKHCTLDGCPQGCSNHGQCVLDNEVWLCRCDPGWGGHDCKVPQETNCRDDTDNDGDGLIDCADSECCFTEECHDSLMCLSSPDPLDILLRKQPPAVTASFYQKMKFLIEEDSVQSYAHRDEYSESQFWSAFVKSRVSVIRGRVMSKEGNGLIGIRVSVATDPQFGFTLTRNDGWYDILVNGGGAVTLQFQRNPFHPLKRTVLVPWNEIIVMIPVIMSATDEVESVELTYDYLETCQDYDYDTMKPIVYQTWKPVSQEGCTDRSAVVAETQVLQESLPIPGSDLHLVYHSSHAQGYLSTIHLQLTPSIIPRTLRLVHLRIVVEGILFEKVFEADPDIKYTFAWNKRNIYKQKVYGLTIARVFVGYDYISCRRTIWTAQAMILRGYDMDTSELGGWNLVIHHRYNFHEGVLQKGDGTTIYFRQQPRVISVLMGTGQQRPLLCPECNGMARDSKLLAPVALTSGPDGSVYVGDFNLIRRITPSGQVYTVFRMRTTEMSTQYHITLSPTDGHLYLSDPERHQILRIHSLDKVEDPDSNFDVVVGSGERCLPRDKENCGDGKPALEARLSYPKGMAVAVDNTLYFADGSNIRMVDSRGVIHTLIGDHHHKRQWRPIPCSGALKREEAKLRWPTDLAINPLDSSLYFIDDHMVLKLTTDNRIIVVAGQPVYCKPHHAAGQKPRITGDRTLGSLIGFTFGPTGTMYIAEVDSKNAHKIRILSSEGELHHFAGRDGSCECDWQNCSCSSKEEGLLAVDTRLLSVTSLTVTSDGVVHIADQGSLRILSAIPYLPPADEQQEFHIAYPESHEVYVFNKYGQHVVTRNVLTGKMVYTFLYNVNTSFGKLSAVTDIAGNKVSFLRDAGHSLQTIENARGQKCRVQVTKQGLLESFTDPDNLDTSFEYDGQGLLTSRTDGSGRSFFYLSDDNGRLTHVVKPTGTVTSLSFDLGPEGASVMAEDFESGTQEIVTVKGTTVVTEKDGIPMQTTLYQDGTIEVDTPWQQAVVWEATPHPVLTGSLPVQAGMFPVPINQISFQGEEQTNKISWNYELKFNRRERDEKQVSAVERVLMVNDTQYLTVEYDLVAVREIVYNSSRRPFLVVQYDAFSRPVQWLPTETRLALNIMYERLGRLSGWQQGTHSETLTYDRMGHLSEVKYSDNNALKFGYDGKTKPSKVTLPSGRKYTFHYDEKGGLKFVTTPKGTKHTFQAYVSLGFYKLCYTPPGNSGTYVIHFNDYRQPLVKYFPGDHGRILYQYNKKSLLKATIYGGGKIQRNYTSSGLVHVESWKGQDVDVITEFLYKGSLMSGWRLRLNSPFQLTSVNVNYQHNGLGRISAIMTKIGTLHLPPMEFVFNISTGKIERIGPFRCVSKFPNETAFTDGIASFVKQFDALHRLRKFFIVISEKEVYRMDIQHDSLSNVVQSRIYMKHLGTAKVRLQNYSYDEDGQLVEMVGRDHWKFHYDQNGNMVTMQYMGNKIDILHDVGDRIVSFGETPYVVDGRGFVVQRGEERFLYNTKGQLIRAFRTGRYDIEYFYDARGRLAVRKDNLGNVTQFFYANPSQPSMVTHIYNNADGRVITLLYDDRNFPVLIFLNKESFYIATDHTGSPLLVYDIYGDVVKEIHRGPYGHVLFDSNPNFYLPVDFQGGLLDPMTGLIHFGEKIYDSLVGQWMSPAWDEILNYLADTRKLHLYRFNRNDPVNLHAAFRNKLDITDWIRNQGIGIDNLDLGATSLTEHKGIPAPVLIHVEMPSVHLLSGLTCAVQKKLDTFSRLTSVDQSKVKKDQFFECSRPTISTQSMPFGQGIVLARDRNRIVVRASGKSASIRKDVVTQVFNNSYLMDVHMVMHGQDVFYVLKDSTWQVGDDLNQLQRLGNMVNTSVHERKEDQKTNHQVDVRIHAHHIVVNIRYGSSEDKERQRLVKHAMKHAVTQRWVLEKSEIVANQRGSFKWTDREREELLNSGAVSGYTADFFHDPDIYPELADDPANVVFRKSDRQKR